MARELGTMEKAGRTIESIRRTARRVAGMPPVDRSRRIFKIYNGAGGSLLAEGLAYSALFAVLTGLLFSVAVLGYLVPDEGSRQRVVNAFTGQLAVFAPIAQNGLNSVAANANAFSIVGLAGLGWGASHFYGALDRAFAGVFARAPARGPVDRLVRGFASLLLLLGGLLSGVVISAVQRVVTANLVGPAGEWGRLASSLGFPLLTAAAFVLAVSIVYRIVPNTHVPLRVLAPPAIAGGLILTVLTQALVDIEPLLAGALSIFGGVAAVFVALAWLHLAFQVLLLGASWTRLRLDEARARGEA
jgi:membrane protein